MKILVVGLWAGFLALSLVSCSHSPVTAERAPAVEAAPELPKRIIDAHAHWDSPKNPQPTQAMLDEYVPNGVVGAVVHSSRKDFRKVDIKADSPVKYAVCAAIVPGAKVKDVERGIRAGDYQCMKIYLAYVPKWSYDAFYTPFYQLAEKTGVPVVFHTGDPFDKMAKVKYADPLTVDEIAVTYPKVTFVIAHMGNPWIQTAGEVVYKNDNVYVDTSALLLDDLSKLNPESVEELVVKPIRWFYLYVENPRKILFGTDWPLLKVKPYIEAVARAIPKEHWDDVFHNNAARVFKLSQPTGTPLAD
jgi:predicted TIM-barrel fold metal-dependent hydrolase